MDRWMRFPGFKKKAFTMSYDDAVQQDARLVDIMLQNGLKGTFNICTERFVPEGTKFPEGQIHRRMTKMETYDLFNKDGIEIAVHGCRHPRLEALPDNECAYEILQDRTNIEKATGKLCRGMAYPYGTFNEKVKEIAKMCGILYARTIDCDESFALSEDWLALKPTCHHNAPNLMALAKEFVEMDVWDQPRMFYLWGHSFEFEANNNWNVIEEFASFMGKREDVWYATNIEIFEYIEAYKQMRVSNDGKIYFNPTSTTLYFDVHFNLYELKPGETLVIEE